VYDRAVKAGAKTQRELMNQFYGDRSGIVLDPVGNQWTISQHVEDVSEEELMKRMKAMAPA
jgi:PhnB protein